MHMDRREYKIEKIKINGLSIEKIIIDPHYEENHSDYMNDDLIIELVKKLNNRIELPVASEDGFDYFATLLIVNDKQYRLIWLLEENAIYIGIVNAYRDNREV